SLGLLAANERCDVRCLLVIRLLLLIEIGLAQVDKRRSIDVDVVEPSRDGLPGKCLHVVHFRHTIDSDFLRMYLEVIALNENWSAPPFAKGCSGHHRYIFGRTLVSVGNLRPRYLEKKRARVQTFRSSKNRPRCVIR